MHLAGEESKHSHVFLQRCFLVLLDFSLCENEQNHQENVISLQTRKLRCELC